jgi:hypothetical protein
LEKEIKANKTPDLIVGFAVVRAQYLTKALDRRGAVGDQVSVTKKIALRAVGTGHRSERKTPMANEKMAIQIDDRIRISTFQSTAGSCGWPNLGASPCACRHRRMRRRKDTTKKRTQRKKKNGQTKK